MSNKKSIENYDTPPESNWTYCVKFVHFWLSKIFVLLPSSLSSGVISEYAEYLYFEGLPKKIGQTMQKTLGQSRLWYYVT